jgi:hypothetical protein
MFAACESTREGLKSEKQDFHMKRFKIMEREIFHPNAGKTEMDFPISRI